ncbi:MAG: 7-carboxy-7-deazaguanine synthase [Bacteroidetes bacterium]|nr:7-carboxy-7-deazaguanine synthase [Bacteroidota bacterium]MCY4204611.1 7-carboxy-7-deazaguanine synthase [Bacteroidota bacterium]
MAYAVKEIYYTLQGEGHMTGRPAVFLRFAGCNLWSGHERDRASAICQFCDTDFVGMDGKGGGRFATSKDLADAVCAAWPGTVTSRAKPYVVCTGGEPLLQLDSDLVELLQSSGFEVAVETNGTLIPPEGLDWICVSPKAGAPLLLQYGHELKLVFPQTNALPREFEAMEFEHFFLQPMDGPELAANTQAALAYCLEHPQWRLSIQTHKVLDIP